MIILQSNYYNIKFAKPTFKKSNALFLCLVSSLIGPSSLPFDDNNDDNRLCLFTLMMMMIILIAF